MRAGGDHVRPATIAQFFGTATIELFIFYATFNHAFPQLPLRARISLKE